MSTTPTETGSTFPSALEAVERIVSIAGPHLGQMLETALPTSATLKTLADEVKKAVNHPKSVAHPELADPDQFWKLAAFPQAQAVVRQARSVLVEVADELEPVVEQAAEEFEAWLRAQIVLDTEQPAVDPDNSRAQAVDAIASRCGELHEIIASVDRIMPPTSRIDTARFELALSRRRLVDEAAKRTGDHHSIAEAKLRQDPPFRHQDLVLDAHEMARTALANDMATMVTQLTAPIFGIGERMVRTYGEIVGALDAQRLADMPFGGA